MDILTQSALVVAVISFALGFSLLARNVRNKLFLAFSLLCVVISVWATCFFLHRIFGTRIYYTLHLLFNTWIAPAALTFIGVMIQHRDWLSRIIFHMSLGFASVLSFALLLGLEKRQFVLQLIYFSPAIIAVQTLLLMLSRKELLGRTAAERTKRMLIYGGALLVLGTSVMDHVKWSGDVVPVVGNLALVAYLFFLSQAISQMKLLNLGALFTRFLIVVTVALTLTLIYSVLSVWVADKPALFFLNSFFVSLLITMLLDPLRLTMNYLTRRLLTQKHQRLEDTVKEAQRRLTAVVNLNSLFDEVLKTVELNLRPQSADFYTLRSDGTRFRKMKSLSRGNLEQIPREILADHYLLNQCRSLKQKGDLPVLLKQNIEADIERSASRVQKEKLSGLIQGLAGLDCNLFIPLFDEGTCLGFVAISSPEPPAPWEKGNWGFLQILYPYFEGVGSVLRNMEVYVKSREKERLATLGEMAAGLAHEIRNPLGAIKGAAQFLDPSKDRPESKFLSVIIEEVNRLNRVVSQFLDYSKPEAADLQPVDLNEVMAQSVKVAKAGLPSQIEITMTRYAQPAWVLASSSQLQQVLMNLIQNASHALENRQNAKIQLQLVIQKTAGSTEVQVTVEDNGKGIQRDHLDKLFIPFFTTNPSGTGLGLSICQKIVEAHRGRIEVWSEEGKGSRFTVDLPFFESKEKVE